MAFQRKYTEEQYAQAKQLVDDGATIAEASSTVGIPYQSLYRKIKTPDPVPGGGGRRRSSSSKPGATDEQLVSLFTKAAILPAIPMKTIVHCDFCTNHFLTTGPQTAKELVELSRDHPALRSVMEGFWREWQKWAWGAFIGSWIGVPVAHHLAPDPVYSFLQAFLGLPARGQPTHTHAQNGNAAAEPPNPFAGLDIDSMLRMAESMGIKIELPNLDEQPTQTPPDTTETAEAAETTTEAETVASDTDADE